MSRSFYLLVVLAACLFSVSSASAEVGTRAGHFDLSKVDAKREVKDTILTTAPKLPKARIAATTAFVDDAGRAITIDTTIPGLDLGRVANVLNSVYHGNEIAELVVHVVSLSQVAGICGDPQAIACYLPTDPANSNAGQIWIPADDPDWVHSLVHEYGHHIDNQLVNFAHLSRWGIGVGCDFSGDGSREWFFARDLEDDIFDAGFGCDGSSDWEFQLAELYAEDFVALNGINAWQLPSARSPTSSQLEAMKSDIDYGLYVKQSRYSRYLKHRRTSWRKLETPNISFLRVRASGASGRDFDIYLFKRNSAKVWAKSIRGGRVETLLTFIPPGKWEVAVYAYKKAGTARIQISIM